MAGMSTYLRNAILDAIGNATAFSVTTPYISLHTADPGITGASECTGGSYARQATSFSAAGTGAITTDTTEDFTNMPACTVTYVGLWDNVSGGNFLWSGALTTGRTLASGDTLRITAGDYDMSLT